MLKQLHKRHRSDPAPQAGAAPAEDSLLGSGGRALLKRRSLVLQEVRHCVDLITQASCRDEFLVEECASDRECPGFQVHHSLDPFDAVYAPSHY